MTDTARLKQLSLVAFMQASNVSVYPGSWRYPSTERDYLSVGYYERIARTLERGYFDMMFFDDRLAIPNIYNGSPAAAIEHGASPVKLDLTAILGALAGATQHIGLGATYSTTYYAPFHVARTFATLDHLSQGRIAWNIVTSLNDGEAQNFGVKSIPPHDERYDRADEFLEAVTALWDSWDADAIVEDIKSGVFADANKVHEVNYEGKWFSTRGPLTVPRSPQGRPVLMQAGSSGRGRQFAARWAEAIFVSPGGLESARQRYVEFRDAISDAGRDPETVKILPLVYTITGETEAIAREKEALFLGEGGYIHEDASLALISEGLNYDFGKHDLDSVVSDEIVAGITGSRGVVEEAKRKLGKTEITFRDLAENRSTSVAPRFVGTGEQVADQMEAWLNAEACNGFVLPATHSPGTYEDVVRLVVPELQRRGIYRTSYGGSTLRDSLGIERPT